MADGNVGRVNVELGLDDKNLKRGIKQAVQSLEKIGDSAEAVGRDAEQSFNRAGQATQQFGSKGVRVASDLSNSYMGLQARVKGVETATERYKREMESLNQATNKAQRNLSEMGRNLQSIGTKMSMSLTLPLVATSAAAIKVANDFEFSMASIVGLVGVASEEVQAMEDDVRSMGKAYGVSATQAADALFFITSAGLRGADATGVLEQALKASAIGLGETAVVADLATSALNAYGADVLSASDATDVMVATVREGKLQANELAGSMGRVLPLASAMGVGFNEVGAAFAALSRTGTDASEAATQIRGILSSLLNPTKQAEDALSAMGLSSENLRQVIREDGLLAALGILAETFKGNEEAAAQVFGNIRALSGVLDLMGANVETTRQIFANMEDNVGDTDKAFQVMSSTGAFQVKQAMAQMKDSFLALGQAIVPVVLPVLGAVTKALNVLANGFNALPGPIKNIVTVLGGLVAATGPLLVAVGLAVKVFAALKLAMAGAAGAQGAGLLATGMKSLIRMLSNPYFLGAAGVAVGIGLAFRAMGQNAREAQERQERVTDALRNANDPTLTLVDSVTKLAEAYKEASSEAQNVDLDTVQESILATELAAKGVESAFRATGLSFSEVGKELATGTDAFDNLRARLNNSGVDTYASHLESAVAAGVPFADSLLASFQAGEINANQLAKLVEVLDRTADAFDDAREANDAQAQTLLFNEERFQRYIQLLGADFFIAIRDGAVATAEASGAQYVFAEALETVEGYARRVEGTASGMGSRIGYVGDESATTAKKAETLGDILNRLRATSQEGTTSFSALANELGILGDVMANDLQLMLLDAQDSAVGLFDSLADGETTFVDVEKAVRQAANQIGQLVVDTTNLGGETSDAIPTIVQIMRALYDGADAAGVSKDRVRELIAEIGFLDQLSPEIAIALTLDTATIQTQIETLIKQISSARSMGEVIKLSDELAGLREILGAIESAEAVRAPSGGGRGGGGGGSKKEEDPFAWVEGWVDDLAKFTEALLSRDFADRLVSSTAPEIADALAEVLDEAMKLAVNILPGGEGLEALFNATSEALQGLANQLEDTGDEIGPIAGLRTQFKDAVAEVRKMEGALEDLEDRFASFNRIEIEGRRTASELLDIGLDKYDELKNQLDGLRQAYSDFTTVENPLDAQLTTYQEASDAVQNLRDEIADLDRMLTGPSGLDLERSRLDNMASSLENLRSAQVDFAESTARGLSAVPFGKRGGALFQAKRYLGKVEAFRDILSGLRDREFPVEIIREVLSAGIDGGTALGKKLLSLSDADLSELKRVQETIGQVTGQIGTIASDILFTAEVSEAEAAFDRQMSLVKQMYATALADAEANFASQKAITQGLYEQQIAQAEAALENQKIVVQGLFQSAIAEAKQNLEDAKNVARELQTALQGVEDAMRDLIKTLTDMIANATRPATGGSGTRPVGGNIPGTNIPIVIGTDDTGQPGPGEKVGGPDRLWGGVGGGGVVDGVYIPPGIDFGALGRRAKGGPVGAGSPYMVGELGPELFVPRSSGTIIPNDMVGASTGGSKNYTINVNIAGGQNIGREVVRAIEEYERRNGKGWRS